MTEQEENVIDAFVKRICKGKMVPNSQLPKELWSPSVDKDPVREAASFTAVNSVSNIIEAWTEVIETLAPEKLEKKIPKKEEILITKNTADVEDSEIVGALEDKKPISEEQ